MIHLVLFGVALCLAIVFGVQTGARENVAWKLVKVFGMVLSVVPIVGIIQYFAFKGRRSGYGEKCGAMALVGVVLYVVTRAL